MGDIFGDQEATPRASKKSTVREEFVLLPGNSNQLSDTSSAGSELESHKSGRVSPTKQLTVLEDLEEPALFYDFGTIEAEVPEDVEKIRACVQLLGDGVGILGYSDTELKSVIEDLDARDRARFRYAWANDRSTRQSTGRMPSLSQVQLLVDTAIVCESERAHENRWNEEVHYVLLKEALSSCRHARKLTVKSVKTAPIDPKDLADAPLPKRVVDYAIALKPDQIILEAWERLKPLPNTAVKSWNHITAESVRKTPMSVVVETKKTDKSWTDGKPQLAIWSRALIKRLQRLPQLHKDKPVSALDLQIPAMPLIIAQGHDWYLLIISQRLPSSGNGKRATIVWQKVDIGTTRNCFDTFKIIAVLHYLADWAETVWRPWFQGVIKMSGVTSKV